MQTFGAGLSEPKSFSQNLNISTSGRVNKTRPEPEPNHTLLKQTEVNHLGFSNHELDQLGATGGNPQSQVLLNHAQPGAVGGYYESHGPVGQVQIDATDGLYQDHRPPGQTRHGSAGRCL